LLSELFARPLCPLCQPAPPGKVSELRSAALPATCCEGTEPKWAETFTTAVATISAQSARVIGKENGMGVFRPVFVVVMGVLLSIHCFQISKIFLKPTRGI
jgi:hypothetical protein